MMYNNFYFELSKLMHQLAVRNGNIIYSDPSEILWWIEQKLVTDVPVCLVCKQKLCDIDEVHNKNNSKLREKHAMQHAKEYGLLALL